MHDSQNLSRRAFLGRTAALAAAGFAAGVREAPARDNGAAPFVKRLPVAPFPPNLEWINSAGPIDLGRLRGHFVLLDFWTLGCINCMHLIPELRKLEKAWPEELVVIGVHSAKFESERDIKNIQAAALRYGIEHPVVNDSRFAIWNSFGIQAWPSLVLIDPEGYAVWGHSGEITFAELDGLLRRAVPYYRRQGSLAREPVRLERKPVADDAKSVLRFPGKILADEPGRRLFISDSGHNRILLTRLDGSLLATIGSGASGRADGTFATAQFNAPQGLALDGDTLYVADTWNHLIRRVDLAGKRVTTIAGTGEQNRRPVFGRFGKPTAIALSSPWDLLMHDGSLYIAMAGLHQIWVLRPSGAGNGNEDIADGPIAPRRPYQPGYAAFAQPSGLATDGHWLFVADSEGSSIRAVPLGRGKEVRTLVGTAHLISARLFTFGDVDGRGDGVRLQHPLGLAFHDGKLYVADTYNNKIKVIDPADGGTRTLLGTAAAGRTDDPPAFNAPGGISLADDKLYVADTDNHLIRVVDLAHGDRLSTLSVGGGESRS
jgi:DNA-binding beta-propeller fold protein YncE